MGKADALKLDDEGEACTCLQRRKLPSSQVGTNADFVLLDDNKEDDKEAVAGGEASKASAVAHVAYRAAEIVIRILCILCSYCFWCIQWMGRASASALPASILPERCVCKAARAAARLSRREARGGGGRVGAL